MQNLKKMLLQKEEELKLIKHRYNTLINNYFHELNEKHIHYEIGWVSFKVSLVSKIIEAKIQLNNQDIFLYTNININTIFQKQLYKDKLNFTQINHNNIVDSKIWLELKNRLINTIDEFIGFND